MSDDTWAELDLANAGGTNQHNKEDRRNSADPLSFRKFAALGHRVIQHSYQSLADML